MQSTLGASRMSRWPVRGATFVLWLAAAGSTAWWALKLAGTPVAAPVLPVAVRTPAPADPLAVGRLLGAVPQAAPAAAAAPSLASRFVLQGLATGGPRGGAALIGVDGKPPRPYRVGAAVEDGLVVQAIEGRQARLGPTMDAPPAVVLELPPRR